MQKRKKGHTTPNVCVPLTHPRRNIPSEHDKQARFRLQQSVLDSFHTEIWGPVFLSIGSEAKLDMFNNFDLDKLFDLHLDLPSSEDPPLSRIIQEGKDPILTTDFYLTNVEPKLWILPTPLQITILPHQVQQQPVTLHQKCSQTQFNQEKLDFICGCYICRASVRPPAFLSTTKSLCPYIPSNSGRNAVDRAVRL